MPDTSTHIRNLAQAVLNASRPRPFLKAVRAFTAVLDDVPNSAVSEWSPQTLAALRTAAEAVVDAIEQQIADAEAGSFQRELAAAVYEVRRSLEEIDKWERHYLGT